MIIGKNLILGIEHTEHNNRQIIIYNGSKPNTIYTLIIETGLIKDTYGQTLEHDYSEQPIQFQVHDSPSLIGSIYGATGM